MDLKTMLLTLLGLPAEADDAAIQAAFDAATATPEPDGAAAADTANLDAVTSRAVAAEAALAALRAESTVAILEREGFAIASRADVIAALTADHDGTLKALRGLKPAVFIGEPLRSRASARAPVATTSEVARQGQREQAISAVAATYHLKSRADAVARAQRERPDLWK